MNTKKSSVWGGAMLLTAAALIVKLLSAVYRIPYQNLTGDFGFYVFQQAYPFYAIAAAVAFTGFPMALSKMIATEGNNKHHLIKTAFWTSFLLGTLSFVILFFSAPYLAGLMGDAKLSLPVRVVAVLFLFIPYSAFFRGAYQGYGDMQLTAVSQLVEQTIRVSGILLISFYFVKQGYTSYETGAGALTGSVLGSVASGLLLFMFWKKGIRMADSTPGKIRILYGVELIKSSIYLSLSALVLALMQLVDAFLFVNVWTESGIGAHDAKLLKGVFDRGQPLLQLGTVAAASIALAVVPEMANLTLQKKSAEIKALTALSVKLSFVFGGAAAVGLICIMKPLNVMLYKNADGSSALAILCVSILFVSLTYTSTGLLQGIGYGRYTAFTVLIAIILKGIGNITFIPFWGMKGAALSTVFATFIAAVLQLVKLQKTTRFISGRTVNIKSFLVSLLAMGIVVLLWVTFLEQVGDIDNSRSAAFGTAMSASVIGAVVYLFAVVKMNIFTKNEWESVLHSVSVVKKIMSRLNKRRTK
jgi:polysaccharide transporter, PST family